MSKGSFLKLPAAVLRVVWSRRQPLSSTAAVLGMLDGPQECVIFPSASFGTGLGCSGGIFRFGQLRSVQGGCCGYGPVHALVAGAVRIGFGVGFYHVWVEAARLAWVEARNGFRVVLCWILRVRVSSLPLLTSLKETRLCFVVSWLVVSGVAFF